MSGRIRVESALAPPPGLGPGVMKIGKELSPAIPIEEFGAINCRFPALTSNAPKNAGPLANNPNVVTVFGNPVDELKLKAVQGVPVVAATCKQPVKLGMPLKLPLIAPPVETVNTPANEFVPVKALFVSSAGNVCCAKTGVARINNVNNI